MHRRTKKMSLFKRTTNQTTLRQSKRNSKKRRKRPTSQSPSHSMRRHPRSILRPPRTIQNRRRITRHKLPLHGRLRRQRLLLHRKRLNPPLPKSPLPKQNLSLSGQPRISPNHTGLWFLRRMST